MGIVCDIPSPKSITRPAVPKRTGQKGSPCTRHGVHVETLKHDLRHAFSGSLGVQKGVREQSGILFRRNTEFLVERVMQDFLHVVAIREESLARSKSSVPKREARIWSQVHACCMIPSNGVYRVRRRRFAEVRSGSIMGGSGKGGSTIGGSGNGVSIICLVSISALSTSFSMFMRLSSITAFALLMVDVELELVDVELVWKVVSSSGAANSSERESTTCETSTAGKGNCEFTETALCSWV